MASFEKDEVPMLSTTCGQLSDEPVDSNFQRLTHRTRSGSISIPMAYLEQHERPTNLVGHTGPLRTVRKTPFVQMSGPLFPTPGTGNILQHTENKVEESKTEKFSTFDDSDENHWNNNYDRKNEHLVKSGQLGMCNDPYCTTCPTYFKASQHRNPKASTIFDSKLHNSLHGDAKGFGRKVVSFCYSCIPGVMNPQTKVVQQWNKILAIFCMAAIFVDPLFFFSIYVKKDNKCIVIDWTMATKLIVLRSINDVVYFLNILLQFRLAYISPESTVVGSGDLVDNPMKIALNYFKGYFFLDLFVLSPLPQIMILFFLPNCLASSGASDAKNFLHVAIFVQYILRLFRFMPMVFGQSPTRFIFQSASANLVINLLILMLSGHVVGSCWYLFGLQRVNQCLRDSCHRSNLPRCMELIGCDPKVGNALADRWRNNEAAIACLNATSGAFPIGIYAEAIPLTTETNVINKYVYALFWGFQQISTLAGNQIPSHDMSEVLFTMAIIGSGLLLFAFLIGNIQNFLQALGRSKLILRGRDVEQWMSHQRLPQDLRRRVYHWAATSGVNEEMILENLPEDLTTDIKRHLFTSFIKKVRIFTFMDERILDAIPERLKQTTYIKGSRILSKGGLVEKMVLVVRGKLESTREDEIPLLLSEGDVCGEELLTWYLEHSSLSKDGKKVRLPGQRLTSNRTVTCLTNVEAFSLRAADIEEVTILFTRFLQSPNVQGALRFESPYWRSLAANRIQVAWRYRKKRLSRANTSQVDPRF